MVGGHQGSPENAHKIISHYISLGGDLFERVSAPDYKLTEEKVQMFMRQIIQGLEYIHHLNIVHLDIKPYNILFSDKADIATN